MQIKHFKRLDGLFQYEVTIDEFPNDELTFSLKLPGNNGRFLLIIRQSQEQLEQEKGPAYVDEWVRETWDALAGVDFKVRSVAVIRQGMGISLVCSQYENPLPMLRATVPLGFLSEHPGTELLRLFNQELVNHEPVGEFCITPPVVLDIPRS